MEQQEDNMAFAHLHLHTEYSLLDGANRIKPLVARLKELGYTHAAITDHGVMYGVIDFYNECKNAGITPVIGCEVYICQDRFEKHGAAREYSHLILLCENETGYRNLVTLVSAGYTEGFYYRPRIDYGLLRKHSEGLICLSACLSGDLPKMLLQGRMDEAKAYALQMQEIFGKGRYYIELMDHGLPEERMVLPRLRRVALETGIPLVATNDCHYLYRDDAAAQEVLMCIQTGKTLQDETRMRMESQELYVKSEDEMRQLFRDCPEAVDNAQKIADICHVEFDFGTLHLPHFPIETGETALEMLTRLCMDGLRQLYPDQYADPASEPRTRLQYELDMIHQMGYVDYFLIVWDFINYAKSHGIMVGPGRGSGAGSIVAYTLHITMLDPLKYNLLFERFLNPERMSMPDLDIDFCYERRQEVIDYVARKYGSDHVSQIITFGTLKAKAAIRDVGRVLGMSYASVDVVAKAIPFSLDMTLEKAHRVSPQLRELLESDPQYLRLFDMAKKLEGMPRNASTHAAGVLITAKPVTEYVPLQLNDDVVTTQYPMGTLERLGLLKMDFLGLRTLTVIRDTLDLLRAEGVDMKPEDIPMDDAGVYRMISQGDTDGVFQLESGGMRIFLQNMKPECFEDIIAAISLYRPGPMESIPRYISGKQNPGSTRYAHPLLEPILGVTYGCMVYQEQVMQIVRDLAGYSLGRSDLMRRAMAKKKHDVMAQEREYFVNGMLDENGSVLIDGAVRRGVPKEVAEHIFDEMSAFASYAFNKSHAAAYAMVAVQTAWLKLHHPVPFMTAIMNSMLDNTPKVAAYIQYCRQSGIPILPPDVNKSVWRFSVDRDADGRPGIRFGLGGVKNVGHGAVRMMENERKKGAFVSIFDFIERCSSETLNKRAVECLIKAGAFDSLGHNRAQLLQVYESLMDDTALKRRNNVAGQMSLFDIGLPQDTPTSSMFVMPNVPEQPLNVLLSMEREMTGVYITGHPLDEVADLLRTGFTTVADVLEMAESEAGGMAYDGVQASMAGILTAAKGKITKKGSMMGIFTLEDLTGQVEGLVFPKVYEKYAHLLEVDELVIAEGKLSFREEEEPKILVDSLRRLDRTSASTHIKPVKETAAEVRSDLERARQARMEAATAQPKITDAQLARQAARKLYLLLPTRADMQLVKELCSSHPGDVPVYVKLQDEGIALLLTRENWCSADGPLLSAFRAKFGKDGVVIKEAN